MPKYTIKTQEGTHETFTTKLEPETFMERRRRLIKLRKLCDYIYGLAYLQFRCNKALNKHESFTGLIWVKTHELEAIKDYYKRKNKEMPPDILYYFEAPERR